MKKLNGERRAHCVIPAPAFAGVNLSPRRRGAGIQIASGPKGPPSGVEPPLGWNLAQREKTGFPRIKYGAGLSSPE